MTDPIKSIFEDVPILDDAATEAEQAMVESIIKTTLRLQNRYYYELHRIQRERELGAKISSMAVDERAE